MADVSLTTLPSAAVGARDWFWCPCSKGLLELVLHRFDLPPQEFCLMALCCEN